MVKFAVDLGSVALNTLVKAGCVLLCLLCIFGAVEVVVRGMPATHGVSTAFSLAGTLWFNLFVVVLIEQALAKYAFKKEDKLKVGSVLLALKQHSKVLAGVNFLLVPSILSILSDPKFLSEHDAGQGLMLATQMLTYATAFMIVFWVSKSLLWFYRQNSTGSVVGAQHAN